MRKAVKISGSQVCSVAVLRTKKPSKYLNVHCEFGGENYRSKREMNRHLELLLLQKAGEIAGLTREVPFIIAPPVVIQGRKKPAMKYLADFVYSTADGRTVVEDAKGMRTPVYSIKRHLMMSVHGIDILET